MARAAAHGSGSRLALLAQLVEHFHGKEGVNGSSPLEGFTVSGLVEWNRREGRGRRQW
jgi:hypothetical protein